ncbi:cyd operon protein YbgE [Xenorhabdus bovienii]|uniref:Protein ybgE n=2 Tax=Xenorhabdus bovienii TaxID=40576 RepID=A0A077QK34_XENBV|nr:cyd operon protein YbgE [Xenorhabdus bovienii]MDE9454965.1 cyd operon protein YbgE [Xenorhabdus bovienii]MDE9482286.1 cyd operon protein YbgE [Xenorhabdus bovienii]MDE9543330.1 cyd operon protein YbgE [Xenorhabdus bovienii]MDE9552018.1 cyd operon protein YbgE [Xenorhabdus bovienii]MDE9554342.1 cyd operon protein YbgE [Xenorhabdus bovienii]
MLADKFYQLMDKGPLRALILIMALALASCVFWDPARFAANTSSLHIWQGILLIWAVCSGVTFGVGFHPKHVIWRLFFHPLPALLILLFGLYHFFK